jgi:hypothetical protein
MKIIISAQLLIAIIVTLLSAVPVHAEKWTMNEFMIGVWGGPGDEAMARAYQDTHFNTVMAPIDKLEMCREHGLRVLVMNATPEIAAANKDNPSVWGWFVRDEPKRDQFEETAVPVSKLQEADPNHPAYVNLINNMDLDAFFKIFNPRVLSYDYYQWWWGTWLQFEILERHRREALNHEVPLIVWVEVNADPRWDNGRPGATYLPDNEVKLRQSVYTALAYGVKGIQWFLEGLCFKRDADGKPIPELYPAGEDVKKINAELEALGPILIKLHSTGVYHTAPAVLTKDTPGPRWVKAKGASLTIGMFENQGVRYVLVVNRDITKPNTARLDFDKTVTRISRFDRLQRQWVDESSGATARIEIKPGDGELFKAE